MEELIPSSLAPRRRRELKAALSADPALADELEMLVPQLAPERRERFWAELAAGLAGEGGPPGGASGRPGGPGLRHRPAAAVLHALERAALGPAPGSPGR